MRNYLLLFVLFMSIVSCNNSKKKDAVADTNQTEQKIDLQKLINDCENQLEIAVPKLTDLSKHPRLIDADKKEWKQVSNDKLIWTSGFYPGILWYAYDVTKNEKWKEEAIKRTEIFEDFKNITEHHDIGFMMFPAYGKGYEIGEKEEYKDILLTSANSKLYDIAVKHAETTMENHFREDLTSWHVIEYDSINGKVLNHHTKQGFADDSRWSRGQAWGVYGYTMVYKETKDKKFLDFAQKITDKYLDLLPEDMVPAWDFDVQNDPKEEKDASAAAVVAAALLDLSTFVENKEDQERYYNAAIKMLASLGSENYSGVGKADSFLLHSTGAKSLGHEIDVALIYADYYYIEALSRLKKMQAKK